MSDESSVVTLQFGSESASVRINGEEVTLQKRQKVEVKELRRVNIRIKKLTHPEAKIERAKKLLRDLHEEIELFYRSEPLSLEIREGRDCKLVGLFVIKHHEVPLLISTLVSDIVHNLRTALDQMVNYCIESNEKPTTNQTGFPSTASHQIFYKSIDKKLENAPPKLRKYIERLKPYSEGRAIFSLLSDMNNFDKHNKLLPVLMGNVQFLTEITTPFMSISQDNRLVLGAQSTGDQAFGAQYGYYSPSDSMPAMLKSDETLIYELRSSLFDYLGKINVDLQIVLGEFKSIEPQPLLETLDLMIHAVEKVIAFTEGKILSKCEH